MATEEIKFGTSEKERTDPCNNETKEVSITRWDNCKNQIEFFVQASKKETKKWLNEAKQKGMAVA